MEDKNTTVWWGKSNEGHRDTWWCNIDIDIDLHVLNSETFREKAFLKINAYENDNIKIRLMMGKAVFEVEENEKIENDIKFIYEYNEDKNCIIARYQEKDKDYNKIKSKIFEKMETKLIKINVNFPKNLKAGHIILLRSEGNRTQNGVGNLKILIK